ncbi:MAG: nucleotidyltransferase domain-containing protein [Thermodesulfobacteriaceae bacterium]|nr:nucleotidyltransferase domain-containing protein [Thermodesulfobacteriaceae bacterium]
MVEERIREFLDKLKNIEPELVILFGSRARGDYLKSSDYDLIIVSKHFSNLDV